MHGRDCQGWIESLAAVSGVMPRECGGCPLLALASSKGRDVARWSTGQGLTRGVESGSPDAALSPDRECEESIKRSPTLPARLLRPKEAAHILGVTRQFFYDHEHELSFTLRLPGGALRISERSLYQWITERLER